MSPIDQDRTVSFIAPQAGKYVPFVGPETVRKVSFIAPQAGKYVPFIDPEAGWKLPNTESDRIAA